MEIPLKRIALLAAGAVAAVALAGVELSFPADDGDVESDSAWVVPAGYSVIFDVEISDESSVRLWEKSPDNEVCIIQESVDARGVHRSAVSGSCWQKNDPDWRSARGMSTFVFAAPRHEAASVVVTGPGGQEAEPVMARDGLVMVKDAWPHERVELRLEALDAGGKAIGPAESRQFEAA